MTREPKRIALTQAVVRQGREMGVGHLATSEACYLGREVNIDGRQLLNFASCSYLGLSLDERVSNGAIEAIRQYGNSFPTSRSFLSMGILQELEMEMENLFGYPTLLTTSTSLAHIAWLPLLVGRDDLVILDHQVHNSVGTAARLLQASGSKLEVIRHNRMDKLEARLKEEANSHRNIWYLADGVYSMYGDLAPSGELRRLLDTYPFFRVYIDDAHGMSWTGKNGAGSVLATGSLPKHLYLVTSLGKGFGSLGGAMIFQDANTYQLVRDCGGPLIFSSPMVPAVIGASLASAKIHLSPEIDELQGRLRDRMDYFLQRTRELDLPTLGNGETPIFFIPVGNPDNAFEIGQKMMKAGFFQSMSVYPSVPVANAGLRFTVTNWLEKSDIDNMLERLVEIRTGVLKENGTSEEKILRAFKKA